MAIGRDVGVDQHDLAPLHRRIALGDIGAADTQRLDLGAGEHQPGLDVVFQEIVEPRPPVLGDRLCHQITPASRMASSISGRTVSEQRTIGRRVSSVHSPSMARAAFVGEGEASKNSARCSRISRSCQ